MKNIVSIVTISLLVLSMSVIAQDENFQDLYEEYMELNQKLQIVQQQALADEIVSAEAEKYSDYVDSLVQQIDAKAADLIKERNKTIDEFRTARDEGNYEAFQELQTTYERILSELSPYMEQAMMNEGVIERRDHFENVLLAKMKEIEPETQQLLDRLNVVVAKLEQMIDQE